jgi:hypothetical protein
MSSTPTARWPEQKAAHCYDWITPETAIRLALQAYYATCRELDHLPDDPTEADATFNNGRANFAEQLADDFRLRVDAYAHERRIPGMDDYASQELALRHGPRSPDHAGNASVRRRPETRTVQGIHRALSKIGTGGR